MMIFEASVLPEPDSPEITIQVSLPNLFMVLYAEKNLKILDFRNFQHIYGTPCNKPDSAIENKCGGRS